MDPVATNPATDVVMVSASSEAPLVQFYADATAIGIPVAGGSLGVPATASTTWSTWSFSNGAHSVTAADCNADGCNPLQATPAPVTVANPKPAITAPTNLDAVSGVVPIDISAPAGVPAVQLYVDGQASGTPVPVSGTTASTTWTTWSLSDGTYTLTAGNCDAVGCNPADRSAAVDVTLHNTPPAFTAPPGNPPLPVSGVVTVTVMTNAPKVQFYKDSVPFGQPVLVDPQSHLASALPWSTFGSLNRDYTWTAAECDNNGCNPAQSSLNLTLANTPPAITSPADHATVGTTVTINGSTPGGGLAFFVDGKKVSFDGSGPSYSFTTPSSLTYGNHFAWVKTCDATGATCDGPVSPTITFTVSKLSPRISTCSPNPFSPGADGNSDRTSFSVHLPGAEHVSFRVVNGNGQTIQGPHSPSGTLSAGDHVFTWDGRNNAGKVAGDGVYTIVVNTTSTTGGVTLQGTATANVTVDRTAPAFSGITGNDTTTYPAVDGFLDTFHPSVHVNEGGSLWLEITTTTGARVRVLAQPHANSGTFRFSWTGRDAAGRGVPAGSYHYRFIAQDRAGNRSLSRTSLVRVSYQRTLRAGVRVARNGNLGRVSTTNARCTQYSLGFSNFEHGLFLDNLCDRGFDGNQFIYADYTMAVPGAVAYHSISVRALGETIHAPEPISAYVYDFTHGTWDLVGTAMLTKNAKPVRTTFGPISGLHHVSLRHRVRVRIAVPDKVTPEDYDIASVSMAITYSVLSRPIG
jgi:flagellar hook assembly protein FlgD